MVYEPLQLSQAYRYVVSFTALVYHSRVSSNFGDAASPWEQVGEGVETSPETYKIPPPPKEEKKEEKK